ncbi:MAG: hypothetical protein ACP6IQ_02030 [Candidatus Njordarchaeia archaeon]
MGTNYYLRYHCKECGHTKSLHIGKSSCGWTFGLHVYPEKDLLDLRQIWKFIKSEVNKGAIIENEYGEKVFLEEMLKIIRDRERPDDYKLTDEKIKDSSAYYPYKNLKEFLEANHAIWDDEYNLLRRKVDGIHCIGNGNGPYDYIVGNFS